MGHKAVDHPIQRSATDRRPSVCRLGRICSGQLISGDAAAAEDGVVIDVDQAEKDPARQSLLLSGQGAVGQLRRLPHRIGDSARFQVGGHRQPAPTSPLKCFQQGMGQKGQRPGIVHARRRTAWHELPDQHLDQFRIDLKAGQAGGLGNGPTQLLGVHRTHHYLVVLEDRHQRR